MNFSLENEFPKEFFVDIPGADYLVARITLNKMKADFMVEIDVIMRESGKIWTHAGSLYKIQGETEAVDRAVQFLADYLKSKKL